MALVDHDCRGFDGCQVCTAAFFARSRQKWNRFLDRMQQVREHTGRIDAHIVSAVMSPSQEENPNGKS